MKTQYVSMSKKTQSQLLALRVLVSSDDYSVPVVKLGFSPGDPRYPEIILNLKWSLTDHFRTIDLVKTFKSEGLDRLTDIANAKDVFDLDKKLKPLWQIANPLLVSGADLKEGVNNLYNLLTTPTGVVQKGDTSIHIPILILKADGKSNERMPQSYLSGFIFYKNKFTRVNSIKKI